MAAKRRVPLWAGNLVVFGLLFAVVVVYFFWQISQARLNFLRHVNNHAQLVAEVIKLTAQNSVFSRRVTEQILTRFLQNTARFIDYLDSIEPFTSEELTAFAAENGLTGIVISRGPERVSGPVQPDRQIPEACGDSAELRHNAAAHQYFFIWPRQSGAGCIVLGVAAGSIEQMQSRLGLGNLSDTLARVPGICYAGTEPAPPGLDAGDTWPEVQIVESEGDRIAEVRMFIEDREIVVGMCTDYLLLTVKNLQRDFFFFAAGLALLGGMLSLLLYRLQQGHLGRVRAYEREISKERENGALGRAAATIAHEIRNPLNALHMGLQRLQIEMPDLTREHGNLIDIMLEAVRRTNGAVSSLLAYARPQTPRTEPVLMSRMLGNVLHLYQAQCRNQGIRVTLRENPANEARVMCDPDLLHQALENVVKNAVDAQPGGGFLDAGLEYTTRDVRISLTNDGLELPPEEIEKITEPYFTTKADGTGLGLSIVQRIVQAHGGRLTLECPRPGTLAVTLHLPIDSALQERT